MKVLWLILAIGLFAGCAATRSQLEPQEAALLGSLQQLVTDGQRSGEGYFSADGTLVTYQAEVSPDNPFYQIYLRNLKTGHTHRVSPGTGKTTCSWIHPEQSRILFASTHEDPSSVAQQQRELAQRASGQHRAYQWDYDQSFDIFESSIDGSKLKNLTSAVGYDAEGSYSPDGKWIVFASNRPAYQGKLSTAEKALRDRDPSYFIELFIMRSDGSRLRRLTHTPGYDGGPFFSPDGKRITWRRFAPDGQSAEVYTMRVNGKDVQQITSLKAISWAPYYHPSGEYLIFASSLLGHRNFELFIVDVRGKKEPVRVTYREGFDGLPVFSPDGAKLLWSTARTPSGKPQLFLATWNHEAAQAAIQNSPLRRRS